MFRTGVPFGYLLICLFLLAVFVAGVVAFVIGRRWRFSWLRWGGVTLCAFVVLAVAGDMMYGAALEWNPTIRDDAEILGTWTGPHQAVRLAADHTFTYQENARTLRGKWTRNDWTLFLSWDGYSGEMQFIQFAGVNHLLTHPPLDPDVWDGDLGLRLTRD